MKRTIIFLLLLAMLLPMLGCQKKEEKQKFTEYYFDWFDTATVITGYEKSQEDFDRTLAEVERIFDSCHQLYNIYTKYDGVKSIADINSLENGAHREVEVDEKIIDLLLYAKEMYTLTGGKCNVAMGSVLSIWHYYREQGMDNPVKATLPKMEHLMQAAEHTSIEDVIIDEEKNTVFLADAKMTLDVGAIAKGYACEMAAQHLESLGVTGYVINAGGNIRTVGGKPDGSGWTVGIENPDRDDTEKPYIEYLSLNGQSLVTSGSYQRFYKVNGESYHHIIDPDTLMPSQRYLSVSILCKHSGLGDALSTALFNMDYESGRALAESLPDVEAMWVLPDGSIRQTEGFSQYVTEAP